MNRAVLKPILIGFFLAAALFMMPFFIAKAIIFILVVGAIFKFLRRRRIRSRNHRELHPAVADVIRYMSEQEYKIYRQKLEAHYYGHNTKKEQVIEID